MSNWMNGGLCKRNISTLSFSLLAWKCKKKKKIIIMFTFQGLDKIKCPKSMYGNRRYTEINDLSILKMIIVLNDNNQTKSKYTTVHKKLYGKSRSSLSWFKSCLPYFNNHRAVYNLAFISSSPDWGLSHLIYTLFSHNKLVLNKWWT